MPVRSHLRRFARKIVSDVVPGALASVMAAVLVAHYWASPQPPARLEPVRMVPPGEQIVAMIRDEHALMMDFLKQEQEREIARQPLSVKDMKAKAPRRSAETAREKAVVQPQHVQALPPPSYVAPLPQPRPDGQVVTVESAPPPAAEPQPGTFARIASTAESWAGKAIDLTGLRVIPALIRSIPERADRIGTDLLGADLVGGEFRAGAGGSLADVAR
jgi:hypothetical protein